jgi:hypothetical protein
VTEVISGLLAVVAGIGATVQNYHRWHWSRLAFNPASAAFIFIGFLKFYRHSLISPDTLGQA